MTKHKPRATLAHTTVSLACAYLGEVLPIRKIAYNLSCVRQYTSYGALGLGAQSVPNSGSNTDTITTWSTLKVSVGTARLAVASLKRVPPAGLGTPYVAPQTAWHAGETSATRLEGFCSRQIRVMAGGRKRKEKDMVESSDSKKPKPKQAGASSSSEQEAGPSSAAFEGGIRVQPTRIRELKGGEIKKGPVIYW